MSFDDGKTGEFTLPPGEHDADLEAAFPQQLWGPSFTSTSPSALAAMLLSEPGAGNTSLRFNYLELIQVRASASCAHEDDGSRSDEQLGMASSNMCPSSYRRIGRDYSTAIRAIQMGSQLVRCSGRCGGSEERPRPIFPSGVVVPQTHTRALPT